METTTKILKMEIITKRIMTSLLESTKMMMKIMEMTEVKIIDKMITKTIRVETTRRMMILEQIKTI